MRIAAMWMCLLCCGIIGSSPTADAKGFHREASHFSGGRYSGPMRHTYRSAHGKRYYHGVTSYWVTVGGFRFLYGSRNFHDCEPGETCQLHQACCNQDMTAKIVSITASIAVDPKQELPAFVPDYVASPLTAELVSDARSLLAANGIDIDARLFVVAMLTSRSITMRVLVPATVDASAVAQALSGSGANAPQISWHEPTTHTTTVSITANEDEMGKRLCAAGIRPLTHDAFCEFPDACAAAPCKNGGTCIQGVDAYGCDCKSGWGGSQCQVSVPECTSVEAADKCDGAICERISAPDVSAGTHSPTCRCSYGKQFVDGSGCVDRDECALGEPSTCLHGACVESSTNQTAKDHVKVVPIGEFRCLCEYGWKGPRCDLPDPVSGWVLIGGVLLFTFGTVGLCLLQVKCKHRYEMYKKHKYSQVGEDQPSAPQTKGSTQMWGSAGRRVGAATAWRGRSYNSVTL